MGRSRCLTKYLRYKPQIADLEYFLDFQTHRMWAPIHNDLPLRHIRHKETATATRCYNLTGPKLHANTTQVTVGKRPVTGIRLYLEGNKGYRLAGIHLLHLSNTQTMLQNKIDNIIILGYSWVNVSGPRFIQSKER